MQDMTMILRNVQIMFTFAAQGFICDTAQSVTGHNSNIIYVTELKNTPRRDCT